MKNETVKRYHIYLANLDPSLGSEINKTRPVVVISDELMNKHLETVVVCPLTTKLHKKWRSRIQIKCNQRASEIAVDQIRTISKKRLIKKTDALNKNHALQLRVIITEMYGE
ncbi:MAG: type II toxin-antitoxin system PemK/MazF family toxin [Arenicellales bacterium]